jgi:hypothetical protein
VGQLPLLTRSGPRTPLFRLRFEDWVYDGDVRQLFLGESPVHLTPKAFDLLGALLLMVFLNSMESLDPLRHDPRFRALVAGIGLPN